MVQKVVQDLGSLDVMVANAGIIAFESFLNITVESFDRLMAVNARGTMLCYKHAGKQMIAQGRGGRIIGASSLAAKRANPIVPTYSATKFAVRGLTQAAAQEFGVHGITVNAYAPGVVDTPMIAPMKVTDGSSPLPVSAVIATTPLRRLGEPEDVAGLVSYFVSDGASFITGQCISVCGGRHFD
jgi:NAD(P)-dependent dehydrogenase (short-subunit alcohol dehydrogenase family)